MKRNQLTDVALNNPWPVCATKSAAPDIGLATTPMIPLVTPSASPVALSVPCSMIDWSGWCASPPRAPSKLRPKALNPKPIPCTNPCGLFLRPRSCSKRCVHRKRAKKDNDHKQKFTATRIRFLSKRQPKFDQE